MRWHFALELDRVIECFASVGKPQVANESTLRESMGVAAQLIDYASHNFVRNVHSWKMEFSSLR